MKMTLNQEEINKLYDFTKKLKSKNANKVFNTLFTDDQNDMIKKSVDDGQQELTINIDSEISIIFMDAFINNADSIGSLFTTSKVNLLCSVKNVFNKLIIDMQTAQNKAINIWKRKKTIPE